jgi:hypothetical protein
MIRFLFAVALVIMLSLQPGPVVADPARLAPALIQNGCERMPQADERGRVIGYDCAGLQVRQYRGGAVSFVWMQAEPDSLGMIASILADAGYPRTLAAGLRAQIIAAPAGGLSWVRVRSVDGYQLTLTPEPVAGLVMLAVTR